MIDAKAFGAELADIVKAATMPLLRRIEALEKELAERPEPEPGMDGKDADPEAVADIVLGKIKAQLDEMSAAINDTPEAPELPDIPAMVAEAVADAVKAIPVPKDGADGKDGVPPDLPDIAAMVKAAVDAMPAPKDGAPGKDGLDVKDLFRAEGGRLMAVMSDGTTKDLGVFVGKDGRDGQDGSPGIDGAPGQQGEKGAAGRDGIDGRDGERGDQGPRGEKGIDGRDGDRGEKGERGADGLGFDDLDVYVDDSGLVLRFERDGIAKEFSVPMVLDRGIWRDGVKYAKGSVVSSAGSMWVANDDGATDRPGRSDQWRLCVKRGSQGPKGPQGKAPDELDG